MRTFTRTHTTYFDREQVDQLVGGAHAALAESLERRRPHIDKSVAAAADARLELLRNTWYVLLDPVVP